MTQFPIDDAFANQTFQGNVGGVSNTCQAADSSRTRPNNATAYASGGALGSSAGVIFKLSKFFRGVGSTGLLSGFRVSASVAGIATSNMGAIRAHLYNASPAGASGLVDQSQFPTLFADDALKLGTVDFSTWVIGGTGSDTIESFGTPAVAPLPLVAAATATDLYVILVATGAFTPAANQIIQVYASAVLD